MKLIKKKKLKTDLTNIIKVNDEFNDFIDILLDKSNLDKIEVKNLNSLQEHLSNMTIIFSQMKDNVK